LVFDGSGLVAPFASTSKVQVLQLCASEACTSEATDLRFDSCNPETHRLNRSTITFAGGQVTFDVRIETLPGGIAESPMFILASGTLDSVAFEQRDYWRLVYSATHHQFTRSFAVLFKSPINGACNLKVTKVDPYNGSQLPQLYTIHCDADRIPSMSDGRQAGKPDRKGAPGWPWALMMGAVLLFSPAPLLAQAAPRHVGPPADLFLRRWLLLGPIALSNGKALDEEAQRKAFDFDALAVCGGETQLFASTPAACTIGSRELQWKPINSADDVVNLGIELGPKDYAVAYALADLESPSATSVVAGLGSDDAVKVWLNGKPVHRNWTLRAHSKDQDNWCCRCSRAETPSC
jgi:hypothetical protein